MTNIITYIIDYNYGRYMRLLRNVPLTVKVIDTFYTNWSTRF